MADWAVVLLLAGYLAALFAVGWAGERSGEGGWAARWRPAIYALSIAVYCTSWTFFGAVGTAAVDGWSYVAIYLGPAIVFLFAPALMRRLALLRAQENAASIADLLSARYGKSRALAVLVTLGATAGVVPYIALQLRALGASFATLTGEDGVAAAASHDTVLIIALSLAVFAIVFGARRSDAARPSQGLMTAIAAESVVKLAALTAVGAYAAALLMGGAADPAPAARPPHPLSEPLAPDLRFIMMTVLAMAAVLCLPRQFHVTFVQHRTPADLAWARWLFPAYLAVVTLVVIPIALAGRAVLPAGADPDLYVLALPLAGDAPLLAVLAFLGGFSAATAMVIVGAVAVATMVSNDLVVPALMRARWIAHDNRAEVDRLLVTVRRAAIVGLILAAYVYYRVAHGNARLAEIGLVSFVAVAQFAPALLAALYRRPRSAEPAVAGIATGLSLWLYVALLPAVLGPEAAFLDRLADATFGVLDPRALFGVRGLDPLTHGALMSLFFNTAVFAGLSLRARRRAGRRSIGGGGDGGGGRGRQAGSATVADLRAVAVRYLGEAAAQAAFDEVSRSRRTPLRDGDAADVALALHLQRRLAGALGPASARVVVASAISGDDLRFEEAARLLDAPVETAPLDRELLQATLENISQGVSVVDRDMRLVAWNTHYLELFDFPPGFIYFGRPVAEVIRFCAERGDCGPGPVEGHVERRIAHMRAGTRHAFERWRDDGVVLKTLGNPMPDGGYVTSFTDITREKQAVRALASAKEGLEERVAERTAELRRLAEERDAAKRAAERANASKTTFLAAASHDLLQPLNAARLFASALEENLLAAAQGGRDTADEAALADNVTRAIGAADRLLRSLLDISKLDQGGITPRMAVFPLDGLFEELDAEFAPIAAKRGLDLRVAPSGLHVRSDRTLLRSVVQNFISNALRYSEAGGVVVGARRAGRRVRIEVWDTGPGIPEGLREEVFSEFRRLADVDAAGERGAGLGLAIVERIARLLGGRVQLRSRVEEGSVFSIEIDRAPAPMTRRPPLPAARGDDGLQALRVLCVDDEPNVRRAMQALLTRWGCAPIMAGGVEEAVRLADDEDGFDAALVDYHLGGDPCGVRLLDRLAARLTDARLALVTADGSASVEAAARSRGYGFLRKPVDPKALRALLAAAHARAGAAE